MYTTVWTLTDKTPPASTLTSPTRYLVWLAGQQRRIIAISMVCGMISFLTQAVTPFAGGRAIDAGLNNGLTSTLMMWAGVMLAAALIQVIFGAIGHRHDTYSWIRAALTTSRLLGHTVATTGDAIRDELPTGEVVASVATDAHRIGDLYFQLARFFGSLATYVVVTIIMLATSPTLGIIIAIGLPAVALILTFLVRPLQRRQDNQREATGRLTSLGSDTVSGLRILRGIGGERVFTRQYHEQSQRVRTAGNKVAHLQSLMDGLQVLLPGGFVIIILWVGALEALAGRITPGQLVTFYGYAAFLTWPMQNLIMTVQVAIRTHVAASKVLRVLRVTNTVTDTGTRTQVPDDAILIDHTTGIQLPAATCAALVCEDPDVSATVLRRMARLHDTLEVHTPVSLDHVPLTEYTKDALRTAITVSESTPHIFSGTLREALTGRMTRPDDEIMHAIDLTACHDVLESVPDGLDSPLPEKGRSLSGGQRQRVALARALLTQSPRLLLIDPTSAVDAHTEARISAHIAAERAGKATLIATTSPLMLEHMDIIHVLDAHGTLLGSGTHHDLLTGDTPQARTYRATTTRTLTDEDTTHVTH